jgi:NhaP-type Na+/H+ and K+/H+ antiporter
MQVFLVVLISFLGFGSTIEFSNKNLPLIESENVTEVTSFMEKMRKNGH